MTLKRMSKLSPSNEARVGGVASSGWSEGSSRTDAGDTTPEHRRDRMISWMRSHASETISIDGRSESIGSATGSGNSVAPPLLGPIIEVRVQSTDHPPEAAAGVRRVPVKVGMIVLAGGIGKRIGRPMPKQFLLLGGKPLLIHVLEKARAIHQIDAVVVTCPETHLDETRQLIDNHGFDRRFACIVGGSSRQESVYFGLRQLGECDSVIIHEAVRPLVSVEEFQALIDASDVNTMYGIPIPFTVLKGHDYLEGLLDRNELVNVQLPQKFDGATLLAAHEAARRDALTFTEDASLFFHYDGGPVRILPGSETNLKITVPSDIVIAEAMYADALGRG